MTQKDLKNGQNPKCSTQMLKKIIVLLQRVSFLTPFEYYNQDAFCFREKI